MQAGATVTELFGDPATVQAALVSWGRPRLRDLPWRTTRDPWAILVSEVMLQQTQVERVVERYGEFITRWPSPSSCAAAPLGQVLRIWQGLGYPRRARNLHEAAGRIVSDHGGEVPADLDDLLALPGVGPYTARAVLTFAFERDIGVVDTNVGRILARWAGRPLTIRDAQHAADGLVPESMGWLWNQVLMDLGASMCRKRRPLCASCPVRRGCSWAGAGDDPAAVTAAVSRRQAEFEGSDRQLRGIVLRRVGDRATPRSTLVAELRASWSEARIEAAIDSLGADGLVELRDGWVALPG